ncbi:MAG: translation initiation factor 6 [Methanothermococcus sp.]|jgi:translation initiation factor 6|uniref:translation initiation factor IF-6 n=1 Tax=Methanothermococcus TaxID=155862 RepID=UPI00037552BA|nr:MULTISPECIES: translation initiation factor IF-6 [Methanothermococcus]MDK2790662.1 translation initiation factor 6 [Methanothermococcus sp.]MDK2987580.1 translation initiation factor 6 [Methanothermococcus sp.]
MIIKMYFSGISTIGVLSLVTEKFGLFPHIVEKGPLSKIEEVLDIPGKQLNVANSSLIGSLCVANSYGLLLPDIVLDKEVELIKDFLKENDLDIQIKKLKVKNTALGNLITTNDKGCIISEELKHFKKDIEDVLNVSGEVGNIAGLPTVGSNAVATNKGCLVHPLTKDEELEWIKDVLKIDCIGRGTGNKGVTSVGACVLANSKGAIVGGDTTGPEVLKIEEALDLID